LFDFYLGWFGFPLPIVFFGQWARKVWERGAGAGSGERERERERGVVLGSGLRLSFSLMSRPDSYRERAAQ